MGKQHDRKVEHGLENVLKRIKPADYVPFAYGLKTQLEDFRLEKKENPKFVAPDLTEDQENSTSSLDDARIILIEAVGATGKTELTKKMSFWLQSPIFDLGLTKVVAGNSLTGLLTKRMNLMDCFNYMESIRNGRANIIIDALDEGCMKTNYQGYLDFLEDVLSLGPKKECPIILLGRYNAVELAASFFATKDIEVCTLQIEPFTIKQAEEFIDKATDTSSKVRYSATFRDTRDYILTTIKEFFKDQDSVNHQASERFIGYAPVLLSISTFFKENTNYKVVLDELKACNKKSVRLIIDIVERILKRDREQKVMPFIKDHLLVGREDSFRTKVIGGIYSFEEQCARVLYDVMGVSFPELDLNDPHFLSAYNEHMTTWMNEHPFKNKKKIANIVFESYILATLTHSKKYSNLAYEYMSIHRVSYMFAYIYYSLYKFENLDTRLLSFIYESLRQFNNKHNYYTLSIEWDPKKSDEISTFCSIEFVGSQENMQAYEGNMTCLNDEAIELGTRLEYLQVDTPLDFKLSKRSIEAAAPSYIKCRNLLIESAEITLRQNLDNESFMFECERAKISQQYDQFLQVGGVSRITNTLRIVSPTRPEYPLFEYWTSGDVKLKDLSEEISSRYKKLRTIILEFRSHSKHGLAKYYERIDYVMGNNEVGRAVIDALLAKKVMCRKDHLYKLNMDKMDSELGLSYDGIRNFEQSPKVLRFLREIKC